MHGQLGRCGERDEQGALIEWIGRALTEPAHPSADYVCRAQFLGDETHGQHPLAGACDVFGVAANDPVEREPVDILLGHAADRRTNGWLPSLIR